MPQDPLTDGAVWLAECDEKRKYSYFEIGQNRKRVIPCSRYYGINTKLLLLPRFNIGINGYIIFLSHSSWVTWWKTYLLNNPRKLSKILFFLSQEFSFCSYTEVRLAMWMYIILINMWYIEITYVHVSFPHGWSRSVRQFTMIRRDCVPTRLG